ncbi:MAG: hypothetical protein QF535_19960 [Anaerolineales bacterium]|nr:hypothetical protein [Anaerolineales bacterium]
MAKNIPPLYGSNKSGKQQSRAYGRVIENDGATALSLAPQDSGLTVLISGGVNGAAACSLPSLASADSDGLEYTFLLTAANGTGDYDIDAEDGKDFFIGHLDSVEAGTDAGVDFNGSSHDQCTLAASAGAAGDRVHIFAAGGRWYINGSINDLNGWAVGTSSANSSPPTDSNTPL